MLDRRFAFVSVVAVAALALLCAPLTAQKKRRRDPGAGRLITEFPVPDVAPIDVAAATEKALAAMLGRGIDGIITDEPALGISALEQYSRLQPAERLLIQLADLFDQPLYADQ